jgi:hypothetical protein
MCGLSSKNLQPARWKWLLHRFTSVRLALNPCKQVLTGRDVVNQSHDLSSIPYLQLC